MLILYEVLNMNQRFVFLMHAVKISLGGLCCWCFALVFKVEEFIMRLMLV